jgi:aminopeptidase N
MRSSGAATIMTLAAASVLALAGCSLGGDNSARGPDQDPLDSKLARAFPLEVSDIRVTYDYRPSGSRIQGSATMRFELKPGQSVPLFQFNPLRSAGQSERQLLRSVRLDGAELDADDTAELRRVRPVPSAEPAFEIQRHLPGDAHTLRASWSLPNHHRASYPGWFYSNFDDTEGPRDETETMWPTMSSPGELARQRIRLRVHSHRPYTVLGSGVVSRRDGGGAQTWEIDTQRPVASDTVLFAAMPSAQVRTMRFDAEGVPVRIVSDRSPAVMRRARTIARKTITRLIHDFGPFPMPSMQILLTGWHSGMEYYGATRTGIGSLEHELVHMYFGTSAVNETWRDTWFDEAAVDWWQRRAALAPLPDGFRSNIGGGRTAVRPGFDLAAYGAGARILEEIARALGGNRQMIHFLRDLHRRRAFHPFTTEDLIADVVAAQDEIDRAHLDRWLFGARR